MDFSFTFKKPPKPGQGPAKNPYETAEAQFNAIRGCGVTPRASVTFQQLVDGQDPAAFDAAPYAHMLALMAGADGEGNPFSDDVILFNPEGIAAEGDYTAWISQIARLAKGALPLEDLQDALDAENSVATVRFALDGEATEWVLTVEGSTFDAGVLSSLAQLAASRADAGARLAGCDIEGQKLMVFLNEQELGELAEATGLQWASIE